MKLSENFKRSEFACKCGCGFDTVDVKLIGMLEEIRRHFGKPVTINSGARCLAYNRSIGSKDRSQHVLARAADIVVEGIDPSDVYKAATQFSGGVGKYETFTHVDSRGYKARW